MGPNKLASVLKISLGRGVPPFIWGPPGVGKSSVVNQVAKELKYEVIDIRASQLDPVDLRGVPSIINGRTKFNPPDFFPHSGRYVIFFDELPQANQMVQSALLQLALDRRLGDYTLPEEAIIIAAGNRQQDRAGANRVITPLLSRFHHLDLDVSVEDWMNWACEARIDERIVSFIAVKPQALFDFNPEMNLRAFPTPRTWEFASKLIKGIQTSETKELVVSCVGDGMAAEFHAFDRYYRDLPTAQQIIDDPKSANAPNERAATIAVIYSIMYYLKDNEQRYSDEQSLRTDMDAFFTYILRLPEELQFTFVGLCSNSKNQKFLNYLITNKQMAQRLVKIKNKSENTLNNIASGKKGGK